MHDGGKFLLEKPPEPIFSSLSVVPFSFNLLFISSFSLSSCLFFVVSVGGLCFFQEVLFFSVLVALISVSMHHFAQVSTASPLSFPVLGLLQVVFRLCI